MEELTHISLFAGLGGIDLAAEWAGFRTILFVEIDSFCQKVLNKHWSDVPIIGDIKDVTKERIMAYTEQQRSIQCSSRGNEEQTRYRGRLSEGRSENETRGRANTELPVTLITGGFPCQPVSQAGKRKGKEDDRWLWPEMLRVISEVRPTWVVAENVTGLLTMGFYDCLSDLEGEGYETIPFVIPACGVNAPHRRDRIFIVAHYEGGRLGQELNKFADKLLPKDRASQKLESGSGHDAHPDSARLRERWGAEPIREAYDTIERIGEDASNAKEQSKRESTNQENTIAGSRETRQEFSSGEWWAIEPDVGRVAHGVPSRVDRLRSLGNAVVPQQIYPILQAIADIENANRRTNC